MTIMLFDFREPGDTNLAAQAARQVLRKIGASFYCFASTAWASVRPLDDDSPFVPPSEDPDRKEIVWLVLGTAQGAAQWHAQITRPDDGPPWVGEFQGPAEGGLGTFGDLMVPRGSA